MCRVANIGNLGYVPITPCSAWWPGDPRPWWHYSPAWGGDVMLAPATAERAVYDADEAQGDLRDERIQRAHDAHDECVREFNDEP